MNKKSGHHGGAWKVAYADFTTAMMALFMVLWLTAQDVKIKEAVARAFAHPFSSLTKGSSGIVPQQKNAGSETPRSSKDPKAQTVYASVVDMNFLKQLNQELMKQLPQEEEEERTVELELTPEGLRVTVFDRTRKPVFEVNSVQLTEYGNWVFSTLAWVVSRYSNFTIELEGHTERGRVMPRPDYGNWELTADRANAARRKLLRHGVQEIQIRKVAGFADTQPRLDVSPENEMNRRVTVMLKVQTNNNNNHS
jgi:chemotaxis protein MotB